MKIQKNNCLIPQELPFEQFSDCSSPRDQLPLPNIDIFECSKDIRRNYNTNIDQRPIVVGRKMHERNPDSTQNIYGYPFDDLPLIPTMIDGRDSNHNAYHDALRAERGRWAWNLGRIFNTTHKGTTPDLFFSMELDRAKISNKDREYLAMKLDSGLKFGALPENAIKEVYNAVTWYKKNIGDIPSPFWTCRCKYIYDKLYLATSLYGLLGIEFPFARKAIKRDFGINSIGTVQGFVNKAMNYGFIIRTFQGKAWNDNSQPNKAHKGTPDRFRLANEDGWAITHLPENNPKGRRWRRYIRENIPWIVSEKYKPLLDFK